MNAKILIAAHKLYDMPKDDIYLPMHVGSEGKDPLPYQADNEGENISEKNAGFCELTGLYWGWKHLDCDYLGLAHYRRHFSAKPLWYRLTHKPMDCVLTEKELKKLTEKYRIIVPRKRYYVIETLYSHYEHTHYIKHLDITRRILEKKYPEYLKSFDQVMKQTSGHMFNMYIMTKELSDEYCEWIFDILFELEKELGDEVKSYSPFQARCFGRVSELMLNVWLAQRGEKYKEIPYVNMEKIHWGRKIVSFLRAKFQRVKYNSSF